MLSYPSDSKAEGWKTKRRSTSSAGEMNPAVPTIHFLKLLNPALHASSCMSPDLT